MLPGHVSVEAAQDVLDALDVMLDQVVFNVPVRPAASMVDVE